MPQPTKPSHAPASRAKRSLTAALVFAGYGAVICGTVMYALWDWVKLLRVGQSHVWSALPELVMYALAAVLTCTVAQAAFILRCWHLMARCPHGADAGLPAANAPGAIEP